MRFWGLTDLGCVRQQNEDALHVEQLNKNAILCVVCDGMGGAKSGNVASSLAADTFVNEIKRVWKTRKKTPVEALMFEAVSLANHTVYHFVCPAPQSTQPPAQQHPRSTDGQHLLVGMFGAVFRLCAVFHKVHQHLRFHLLWGRIQSLFRRKKVLILPKNPNFFIPCSQTASKMKKKG